MLFCVNALLFGRIIYEPYFGSVANSERKATLSSMVSKSVLLSVISASKQFLSVSLCAFVLMPLASYADENGPIDIDHVMRVAARKLARYDAQHPEAVRYPTDAKGDTWTTVPPSN